MGIPKISKFYSDKNILRGLEYVSEHSALVTSGTTLLMSAIVRPVSILKTPKAQKKDKEFACAKSISSAIVGFGLTSAIFHPISKSIEEIENNPKKFLNKQTFDNLGDGLSNINKSKNFNNIKQIAKILPEILSVIPKAILTTALIVPIVNHIFKKDKNDIETKPQYKKSNLVQTKNISFAGNLSNRFVSKIFNNKNVQKFAAKNSDSNIIRNTLFFKDIIATGVFCGFAKLNPKIKEENKKSLINNSIISTGLTISGAYAIDKMTQKPFDKFLDNFSQANKDNIKLNKYINGLKTIKPIVILSGLYYVAVPFVATYLTEKLRQNKKNTKVV